MALKITTPIQMRFSDADSFGHINNVALQMYFDLGKTDLFNELWRLTGVAEQVPAIVVSLNTDFYEQIFYGDQVVVETSIESIGNKSLRLVQRLMSGEKLCTLSRTVMVCYDRQTRKSVAVPAEWQKYVE
ncbi:MAG: acyl-CoA thioesterase [Alistipes sp.]|nr:acyl-CoA thioesterase [Rikenellaceae bacterium]MBQ3148488.1 acyl-CoA thioesterase [Alistipes sp.]MBQ4127894.1 acyl-CoA thioesterase [Alistipes sp.]MBR6671430.1 acyl-CoA thioesterase [Alistipes sp.]